VIRPFGLTDVLLVRRLQRCSAILAIEHALTHPRDPLWIALTAPWPWAGFGVATYVLAAPFCSDEPAGFVQLMKRPARPEADILYLAPALPAGEARDAAVETLWHALLDHCVASAAGHGLQRLFASIPDGGPEEACLKDAGFSLYTRETVYRLAVAPAPAAAPVAGFRSQGPQDGWALQRLYTSSTPRLCPSTRSGRISSACVPGQNSARRWAGSPPSTLTGRPSKNASPNGLVRSRATVCWP